MAQKDMHKFQILWLLSMRRWRTAAQELFGKYRLEIIT